MKLPKQAAPVERIATTSVVSRQSGLEASSVESSRFWDDAYDVWQKVSPVISLAADVAQAIARI